MYLISIYTIDFIKKLNKLLSNFNNFLNLTFKTFFQKYKYKSKYENAHVAEKNGLFKTYFWLEIGHNAIKQAIKKWKITSGKEAESANPPPYGI